MTTDHVGIGSDFDGISGPPNGLADVSKMPALVAVLMKRGYNKRDLKKMLGENTLRLIRAVTGNSTGGWPSLRTARFCR